MNFFGGTFFSGGFFGSVGVTGGKGDNPSIVKPTGFQRRKTLTLKKDPKVAERVEQSKQIQLEVAEQLAREFGESQEVFRPAIEKMALVDIEREIGALLRRKIRTEEEEIMLLLMMAASEL